MRIVNKKYTPFSYRIFNWSIYSGCDDWVGRLLIPPKVADLQVGDSLRARSLSPYERPVDYGEIMKGCWVSGRAGACYDRW